MQSNVDTVVSGFLNRETHSTSTEREWGRVMQSRSFQELIRQKRAFILPATIFFFVFYMILPILTAYTTVLNGKVIGVINWAHIYAFAQFIMTWGLCHIYMSKANYYDELVTKVKQEINDKGRNAI